MIKEHYKKELVIDGILKKGSEGKDVKKVQEWLNLWRYIERGWTYRVSIDGDFGAQTEGIVKSFQEMHSAEIDGVVGPVTFGLLCGPMSIAFDDDELDISDLRDEIIFIARQHLVQSPKELEQNKGPWVRAYMDGYEGAPWAWCMGFAQTIIDQALSPENKFTDIMPHTFSCDVVGEYGLENKCLTRAADLKDSKKKSKISPADLFLVVKTSNDWVHTGIIERVGGDWIHTLEGNTNDEGSREGYEVCRRMRDLTKGNIDIFHLNL